MKKIGEGYYYNVYDLANNRVLKRQKSRFRIFLFILFSRKFKPDFFREYKNVLSVIPTLQSLYRRIVESGFNLDLLGRPTFGKGIEYEQDKVITIRKFIKSYSDRETENLIESFIELMHELWKYGMSDEVYNFTINNAVDDNGRVILIDFNEVTFDKAKVESDIKNEIWLRRWSYTHLKPVAQRYYKKRMREELNTIKLNLLWGKSIRKA